MKQNLLFIGPVSTQSGYGARSRDLLRALISLDKYNISVYSVGWGQSPLNALTKGNDSDILNLIVENNELSYQPDISIQVSVPNEFKRIGKYSIGVTAGIETTACPYDWIEGCNNIDLILLSSNFSKKVFENTVYKSSETNENLKVNVPMEVLFEGIDTNLYKKTSDISDNLKNIINTIPERFLFLTVGHWLQGTLGNDRKDIGMMIKVFLEVFKNKDDAPGLLLKTSQGNYSQMDYDSTYNKILEIKKSVIGNLPNIYLLHSNMTDIEMNQLYNYDKIKVMASLTKGEGWGRPLSEFTMSGKPIMCSAFGGQTDFLDPELTVLLPGKLGKIDDSAINRYIIKDAQWFTADYNIAGNVMNDMYCNYNKYNSLSKKLMYKNKNTFNLDKMSFALNNILNRYVPEIESETEIAIPKLIKRS